MRQDKGNAMRKFSRWMPPKGTENSALGSILFVLVWAALWPILILAHFAGRRHLRRLAAGRIGEDIGTFARGFNRRSGPFDSWVVRATWDALTPYVRFDGRSLPLRHTDRLVEDLHIDPDDILLDLKSDLIADVAERSGHSLDLPMSNPQDDRMETVGDLVRFVTKQPLTKERVRAGETAQPGDLGRITVYRDSTALLRPRFVTAWRRPC